MSFKIVHTFTLPNVDIGEGLLEPFDAELVKGFARTEDDIISQAKDADAVIGVVTSQPFTRRVLGSLERCRIVAGIAVGYEAVDLDAATEYGIAVTNVPDYGLDEVSGRAIAFMMALGHKLIQIDRSVREKQVSYTTDRKALMQYIAPMYRMREQTFGIIGLGRIGTATALKAKGLGMRVIAYDPYVFDAVMVSHGVEPVDLDQLLRESDYISLHTPLTDETRGMIGDKELKKMKPNCHLINTARGKCVDEAAIIRALEEGLIAGAGLDVTEDEHMSPDNPLLKMDQVILTGHSAWYSISANKEVFIKPMTQVVAALEGKWPIYALNPELKNEWLKKWGK
ncbi:MAG: C-terminal binding protein [Deltaproteobacteria bacterium]|nr:C-terminal binding protein [Deltaproteobacteria bacterium]